MITLGSLFDGSGGFPLAGVLNGITPIWASEIEPYPLRVTAARFPQMEQLGDVTKIDGAKAWPVNIITFGSPCQDLSAAGKQLGIHDGERSNLFFEAVRIIREMRKTDEKRGKTGVDIRPRFAVWENVPGAFSSNKGADFAAVIEALASVREDGVSIPRPKKWSHAGSVVGHGWSLAWRLYDAQYWGVPQRRKRIYLVADFGGERAGEILFEREGLLGNPSESGETREGVTAVSEGGAGRSDFSGGLTNRGYSTGGILVTLRDGSHGGAPSCRIPRDTARSLCARGDSSPCLDRGQDIVCYDARGNGDGKIASTITGDHESRVTDYTVICCQNTGRGWWNQSEIAQTLRTPCGGDALKANLVVALDCRNMTMNEGISGNITSEKRGWYSLNYQNPVVYPGVGITSKVNKSNPAPGDPAPTLPTDSRNYMAAEDVLLRQWIIRRLTPLECCRLQGFPDWWEEGVDGSDTARYKMWGNGIALPCACDVLRRIAKAINASEKLEEDDFDDLEDLDPLPL